MNAEMIHLPNVARSFYFEPLALEEAAMMTCHLMLWPRIAGGKAGDLVIQAAAEPSDVKFKGGGAHLRRQMATPEVDWYTGQVVNEAYYWGVAGKPGVAVIPLSGMIMKGAGPFAESCMGAVNPDRISHALAQAMAAPGIKQIVLDISSPGGRVTYVPELAEQVRAAAQTKGKTVWAFTDTMIASAATWIASQANEIVMTPSAQIGSIGTYLAFLNPKVAMQMQGYSLELFKKGTHKAIGLPGHDLNQADRDYLQAGVDKINAQFVAAVQAGRPGVSEEAVRDAKMYDAAQAVQQGLADGIVGSWDEFTALL